MSAKFLLLSFLFVIVSCASNKVVVERIVPSPLGVSLSKYKTLEVRQITGNNAESFRQNLIQYLTENTDFTILEVQNTNDLINNRLLVDRNRQNYKGADLIVKGALTEEIRTNVLGDGSRQYFVTTRPQLKLIEAETGEVILSKYFIGTSLSQIQRTIPAMVSDVYTDAIISARNVAFDKFISQFVPQKAWLEISLYQTKDNEEFIQLKNLINYGQYKEALNICETFSQKYKGEEKGKALYNYAVVESLRGQYHHSKELIYDSHKLYPEEESLKFLKRIEQMEIEAVKVSMLKKAGQSE